MSWEQLKLIEGGLLLINANDVSELKSRVSELKVKYSEFEENFDDSPDGEDYLRNFLNRQKDLFVRVKSSFSCYKMD